MALIPSLFNAFSHCLATNRASSLKKHVFVYNDLEKIQLIDLIVPSFSPFSVNINFKLYIKRNKKLLYYFN